MDYERCDDGELIKLCRKGDENALAELCARYEPKLLRFVRSVYAGATQADEIVVESFYKIWKNARQWNEKSPVQAWVYRIALRVAQDHQRSWTRWWKRQNSAFLNQVTKNNLRSHHPAKTPIAAHRNGISDPAQLMEQLEEQDWLHRKLNLAISHLNEKDRILVYLYYYESQSLSDISHIMGVSRDALKMRLSRARRQLRTALANEKIYQ